MTLLDYWPAADRVNACIPSEAEALSDPVFLAVHQPPRLFRRVGGSPPVNEPANEADLRAWLLSPDVPEGHRVVPIVGRSGTGKSHLIRWLDIHIPRDGRHVIRIPKSSSLRRVLELILEGLEGPSYTVIRRELLRARDQLSPIAAEEGLLANFRTALRERLQVPEQFAQRAQQDGRPPDPADLVLLDQGQGLLALLQGRTWEALVGGPVCQAILHGVLDGHARPSDAGAQFGPQDFRFEAVRPDQVAPQGRTFLSRLKMSTRDKDREGAAALMNEIRDAAIYPMLGLGPNRLTELFGDVRRELLREGRELVLLIEDFAAVAGIQKVLLDVITQLGVRDGRRVLCTMRTALAVTDGYLSPWDTVRTRTRDTEWVIAEAPTGDDARTVAAIVDIVGAYLNAARVGADELERACLASADPTREDWVPAFDRTPELTEDGRRQLATFGACGRRYPLFPFNRAAVEQLARRHLRTPDGQVRLNPRQVINHIIRDTLITHRSAYIDGRFPPPGFGGFSAQELDPDLRQAALAGRTGEVYERTAVVLGLWGGRPQAASTIRLAPEIFQTFGLDPIPVGPAAETVPRSTPLSVPPAPAGAPQGGTPSPTSHPVPPPPPASPFPEAVGSRVHVLREWVGQRIITQTDANWIRGEIVKAVDEFIDWDAELLKPIRLTQQHGYFIKWVYLPQAKGGEPGCTLDNALVTVCDDATFADPIRANEVELDLRALVRFHELKHFDYEGGAVDQARYANFVERAAHQAVAFVRRRYERLAGDQVPAVTQALLVSARLLDLVGAHVADDAGVLEALLAPNPSPQSLPQDETRWSKLRWACAAERERARQFLLRRVGVRQGLKGTAIYAIDAAQVLAAVAPIRKTWAVEAEFPAGPLEEDARMVRSFVHSVRPEVVAAAVRDRRQQFAEWGRATRAWLGPYFDKQAVIDTLRATVNGAVAADVFKESGDVSLERIRGLIDEFRKAAVSETLKEVDRLADDTDPGLVLSVLARVDDRVLETVDRLRDAFSRFLERATAAAVAGLQAYDGAFDPDRPGLPDPGDAAAGSAAVRGMAAEIDTLLAGLGTVVERLVADAPEPIAAAVPRGPVRRVSEGGGI
jgi:hypothetical protein